MQTIRGGHDPRSCKGSSIFCGMVDVDAVRTMSLGMANSSSSVSMSALATGRGVSQERREDRKIAYQHPVLLVGAAGQQGEPLHSSECVDCSGTIPGILTIVERSRPKTQLVRNLPLLTAQRNSSALGKVTCTISRGKEEEYVGSGYRIGILVVQSGSCMTVDRRRSLVDTSRASVPVTLRDQLHIALPDFNFKHTQTNGATLHKMTENTKMKIKPTSAM
jgi:hypothetical protein